MYGLIMLDPGRVLSWHCTYSSSGNEDMLPRLRKQVELVFLFSLPLPARRLA